MIGTLYKLTLNGALHYSCGHALLVIITIGEECHFDNRSYFMNIH